MPDGVQVAYGSGVNTISQTNIIAMVAGKTYTLDVFAGCRADDNRCTSFGANDVSVQLVDNTTSAVLSSLFVPFPSSGKWVDNHLSYTVVTGAGSTAGDLLGIRLVLSATPPGEIDWDNIRLRAEVLPEPASLVLLGSGIAGLLWVGRRSRRDSRT